jgi:predicted TIM-barrel fold metal-dependent hydrolase
MNDAHCHFFSPHFFATLARQRQRSESVDDLCRVLAWDSPGTSEALGDRWVADLDANLVTRAAMIASVAADEDSVAAAVARHPSRLVGFFMVDPASAEAVHRTRRGVTELGMRTVCLFPAMHHVAPTDDRLMRVVDAAIGDRPDVAIFVHCGELTVGVRSRLGLPSRFDLQLGDPLAVGSLAGTFRDTPFIIPHFGAGRLHDALMVATACPNIYLDTSSSNSWIKYTPGLTLRDVFKAALDVLGPERLLFGTDSSFFPRGWNREIYESQAAIVSELGINDDDRALIFGGNFDRLLPSREW